MCGCRRATEPKGGVRNPAFCAPTMAKMAQINLSFHKFHFFPHYEIRVWGRGGAPSRLREYVCVRRGVPLEEGILPAQWVGCSGGVQGEAGGVPPPTVVSHSNTALSEPLEGSHSNPKHNPRLTFRLVVVSLRGLGQSPVLPFACCIGLLLSVGRCGRCSCWCRCRVCGAQWLVCWGAGCGMVCRLRVSGAQSRSFNEWGSGGRCPCVGRLCTPPPHTQSPFTRHNTPPQGVGYSGPACKPPLGARVGSAHFCRRQPQLLQETHGHPRSGCGTSNKRRVCGATPEDV